MTFRLSKLHGLGNDFLVLLTDDPLLAGDRDSWSRRAVAWCDRRTGVGADGLILGVRGGAEADLVMHLYNADGSRAEMSGNGIRCLAHAEARRRGEPKGNLSIATDGGMRSVDIQPDTFAGPLAAIAAVDMGAARPGPSPDQERDAMFDFIAPDQRITAAMALAPIEGSTFDFGNPHLVLLVEDPARVDVAPAGAMYETEYSAGINVHFIAPTEGEEDAITMRVWERGVGVTEACGTGATAAALAANEWGLVGDRVTVHMPGGDVTVDIGDTMVLHGPSVFVADIEVPG